MKPYVVEWDDEALSMLADIFLRTPNPSSLWQAQDRADRKLEQQPRQHGFEVAEALWQITEAPLKIFYEIDDAKRIVTVTHVALI